jgi:5'-nucleotidase
MHEGGEQSGGINDCKDFKGAAKDIAERLSGEVSVVVTAHTHRYYVCEVGGKLVTSAGSYGTLLTEIDLSLDRASGRIVKKSGRNLVVKPDGAKAADLSALLARYTILSEAREKQVVGRLKTELSVARGGTDESNLANMVADAQLYATTSPDRGGAVIAFNNNDSLRAPLIPDADGGISYGAIFKTQPFQNDLLVMNLTGAQIKALLEQQWEGNEGLGRRMLNVSAGFSYAWDATKPVGQRVLPGSIKLGGAPLQADLQYRVAVNSYLATGGSGMTMFREGKDRQVSVLDIDAVVEYLGVKSPYQPPPLGTRIVRVN